MPDLWTILSAPFVELLGWVLLHFLWQGALLAVGLAGALYLFRDHTPPVRYAASCAALVGLLALPVGTGLVLSDSVLGAGSALAPPVASVEGAAEGAAVPSAAVVEIPPSASSSLRAWAAAWLRPALPWIVLGWAAGVLLFSVRLAGGAWRVRRLRRTSTPASERWRDRLGALADRMGLRRDVALHVSNRVDGPMVAGWWRPVVLVPAGFLTGLPPEQVEALLLHELAHVRRHDVLVGRLQAVLETLLFFHPATWWISRQVRDAREACCDDLTVQVGPDRTAYARALAALAERAVAPRPAGALATSDGALLARIRRLLDPSGRPSRNARRLSMVVALLLLVAFPLGIAACASQQSATEAEAPRKAPPGEQAETPPTPPRAPEAEPEGPTVIVVRDDSIRRVVTLRGDETVKIDSLDAGGYILRYEGESADTLRLPGPESFEEEQAVVDPDSLDRHLRGLRLRSDSLERVILGDVNPDSLKRLIRARFNADSLKRVLRKRFDLDSLAHRALEVRWQADSLARVFEDRFSDDGFGDWPADSTFDVDKFKREDFELDLDVDSLLRRGEEGALDSLIIRRREETVDLDSLILRRPESGDIDSLFHWRVYHADGLHAHLDSLQDEIRPLLDSLRRRIHPRLDSLRRHLEQMREKWERRMPERLRRQARRLREQAERLEEWAEKMGDQRSEKRRRDEPADGGQDIGPFGEASRSLLRGGANGIIHIQNKSGFEWTAPLLTRSGRI